MVQTLEYAVLKQFIQGYGHVCAVDSREVDDLNQLEKIMVAWLNRTEARLGQINDAGIVERNRHLQNHCLEPQKIQVEGILKWTVLLMS